MCPHSSAVEALDSLAPAALGGHMCRAVEWELVRVERVGGTEGAEERLAVLRKLATKQSRTRWIPSAAKMVWMSAG